MRLLLKSFTIILILNINIFAQNQLWGNVGFGRYLANSENSLKVLKDEKLGFFINFGFGYQRDVIFGVPIFFEYNYFQNTQEEAIKSVWTDETGSESGEITGEYKLINHTFDFDYFNNINEDISYGIGPSFVLTNRIIEVDLPMSTPLELYDKLASSGLGINGFVRFTTSIKEREVVVVIGPSGSGKSTWIRTINRLEEHQKGQIIVDGTELNNDVKNIKDIRAEVGMVFQQFNLFPHLTALENIILAPRRVRKWDRKKAEEVAMQQLEKVKIPEQANKFPGQLS